jgi:hypothetical protein
MMSLPPIVYAALAAALVLFLVSRFWSMPGVTRRARRRLWCPVHDRDTEAEILEEVWDGARVDVTRCELLDPPEAVTCGKACLRLLRRPAAAPRGAGAAPLLFL